MVCLFSKSQNLIVDVAKNTSQCRMSDSMYFNEYLKGHKFNVSSYIKIERSKLFIEFN